MLHPSLLLAIATCLVPKATGPHIHVALVAQESTVAPGGTYQAGIRFTMDPGWHIYWQHPGDSGESPTIAWQVPTGWSAGSIAWPLPEALPVPPLMNYGYEHEVLLAVPMQVGREARSPVTLAAHVTWLVCAEICIPGKANLALPVGVGATPVANPQTAPLFERTRQRLPQPLPSDVGNHGHHHPYWRCAPPRHRPTTRPGTIFSSGGLGHRRSRRTELAKEPHPATISNCSTPMLWTGSPSTLQGLLETTDAHGGQRGWPIDIAFAESTADPSAGDDRPSAPAQAQHPFQVIWFALLGGIILNLMPCVFPVLSIKVMSLVRLLGHEQRAVRRHAWLYALGILVGFWALTGVLLTLRAAGERIGWGFQLQSPGFVASLGILLFMFGLSLLGVFEVGGSWMGVGQSVAGRRDALGSFFTGLLATVVATPCSAPFMGSAVGFALTQAPWVCVSVFSALGLGLALPYVALCYVPQLARWMPKPGAWMQSMQQFMGFLLMGTVIWLLWVLERQMGSDGLFVLLSLLLCLAVAAWVLGRWGHQHRIIGFGAWLTIFGLGGGAVHEMATMGRAKSAPSRSAEDLPWEKFSPERVRALRAEGRRIFVDFTAAWCVSCQVNERVVFGSSAVREKIAEKGFVLFKSRLDGC